MEQSGKWGEELGAIARLKTAFYVELAKILKEKTYFTAFHHFLRLLYTHNWLMKPLFVDFNNEWKEEDIDEMEKEFIKLRPVLPAMVICTSVDRSGSRWTREEPQPLILKRIVSLAKDTAAVIDEHIISSVPLNLKV
ncbi:unnamed protein product [Gongylonema pulchrum]|uniref:Nucleolar protein 6 n=1 Tax=Gongylonema pulchrum TaxID=637853 RepID=A0A183EM03_9BILA|nr:unnamed protein product [Gongylonema pulchrum]